MGELPKQPKLKITEFEIKKDGVTHRFRFLNDAPLNASNTDVRVNFLEYWEIKGDIAILKRM